MLYGLKHILIWLFNRTAFKEVEFCFGSADILHKLINYLADKCKSLTPQCKSLENRCSSKSYYIDKNQYLTRSEFEQLGLRIINNLNNMDALLNKFVSCSTFASVMHDKLLLYQKLLFTGFFVFIPVQRLGVIAYLKLSTIVFEPSHTSFVHLTYEKNSYKKLAINDKVGRYLYIPSVISVHLLNWINKYRSSIALDKNNDQVFCKSNGTPLDKLAASNFIRSTTQSLLNKVVGAILLRKLRITHSLECLKIKASHDPINYKLIQQEIADSGGHSVDVMNAYYKLKDNQDLFEQSKKITNITNSLLF